MLLLPEPAASKVVFQTTPVGKLPESVTASREALAAFIAAKEKDQFAKAVDEFAALLPIPTDHSRDAILYFITGEEQWCRLLTISISSLLDVFARVDNTTSGAERVDIIAMHSIPADEMSTGCRRALKSMGVILLETPSSLRALADDLMETPERCSYFKGCWMKFLPWALTPYRSVLYIDADILFMRDPRPALEAFNTRRISPAESNEHAGLYDIAAVPDLVYAFLHTDYEGSDVFNGGFLVVKPSLKVAKELFAYGLSTPNWGPNADQNLLASFFLRDRPYSHNWIRLPASYNMAAHVWHMMALGHRKDGVMAQDMQNVIGLHYMWPAKGIWAVSPCLRDRMEQLQQQGIEYAYEACVLFHNWRIHADNLIVRHGGLANKPAPARAPAAS